MAETKTYASRKVEMIDMTRALQWAWPKRRVRITPGQAKALLNEIRPNAKQPRP